MPREDGGLDRGTVRHRLVGVDALVEPLPAEKFGKHALDLWDAGGAAHRNLVSQLLTFECRALKQLKVETRSKQGKDVCITPLDDV